MIDVKNRKSIEFEKCGEIIFAAKSNKIAFCCDFCQKIFKQLQAFMRHLHIEHADEVEFLKQNVEVDVYAVEELINQSINSCALDFEIDESVGTKSNPNEQVETKLGCDGKEDESNLPNDEETDLIVSNSSILKALADCDVSFNWTDKCNDNKSVKEEQASNLENTLLQEIRNEWEDSAANDKTPEKDEIMVTEKLGGNKIQLEFNTEYGEHTTNSFVEETLEENEQKVEHLPKKCIKKLLQDLEDFDDIDSFLDNLETDPTTVEDNGLKEPANDTKGSCNANVDNQHLEEHTDFDNSQIKSKRSIEKELLEVNINKAESNRLENFEACLQELETSLDLGVTNSNNDTKDKHTNKAFNLIDNNLELAFEQKLKDLEESLTADVNDDKNVIVAAYNDLEKELANLCKPDVVKDDKSSLAHCKFISEDLTRVLADALEGEDLDLLNLQLDEEGEEPLNRDILDLLEIELEKVVEQELKIPTQQHQLPAKKLSSNSVLGENTFAENLKTECENINNSECARPLKFSKTNLKARKRTLRANKTNTTALKEPNGICHDEARIVAQKPLKGNHGIFSNQQQQLAHIASSLKSPQKALRHENTNHKIPNRYRQNKTPNKENSDLYAQKIRKETFTPNLSFVNTERGIKTPIRTEEMFSQRTPKTQGKQESPPHNIIPSGNEITPILRNYKQSPQAVQKQESPTVITRQKTPQSKNKEATGQLPKSPEKTKEAQKNNETLQNNNEPVAKTEHFKSPQKPGVRQSNEKPSTPPKNETDICHLYNGDRTPLTTPSRKFKNVAIKLQRCTPDKFANTLKNHKTIDREIGSKQMDIMETPIKSDTYCKQNFSEASAQKAELQKIKEESCGLIKSDENAINTLQEEKNFSKLRQRAASIEIVKTGNRTAKKDITNSINKTPHRSNLDYKSYAVTRSLRKKEVLQRMRNVKKQILKSIEGSETLIRFKSKPSTLQSKKKQSFIENVEILPKLDKEAMTSLIFNDFKKPLRKNATTSTEIFATLQKSPDEKNSTSNEAENSPEFTIKRRATSPLLEASDKFAKRQHISPINKQNEEKTYTELEKTHLDLSESCVDFLQRDLKASRLNVESLLNSEMSEDDGSSANETSAESTNNKNETLQDDASLIINDLLKQVANEKPTEPASSSSKAFEDFDEIKDIDLLAKFGLKIIKNPEIEDVICMEERDQMNDLARKFCTIYRSRPRIWSIKIGESDKLKEDFKDLLDDTNSLFNLKLNMSEIKRLVNLINSWFTQNASGIRTIEHRKMSDSTNRYLSYFSYIPKTIKRFYCEFCEEICNTEHKYSTHRIIHTGALYPYQCRKCSLVLKTQKQLRSHESLCSPTTAPTTNTTNMSPVIKCLVCEQIFKSSELLYEHSKTHLKNMYHCRKCDKVFVSEKDVKNHLNICNTAGKRIQKPFTPRPPKTQRKLL